MRDLEASGIVLGHKPKHEYDRLVNLFTDNFGKISATAKCAQKSTSPFVGRLETMNVCKVNLYRSAKGKFTITQCKLIKTFTHIKENVALFAIGSAVLEIAQRLTYQRSEMKKYFDLICKTLDLINKNIKPRFIYLVFKIKFLYMLGLVPSFKHCMICHKTIDINEIQIWETENLICLRCLESNKNKLKGTIFEKDMLKFINFITQNSYGKSIKIKISKREIEFLETFLDEIWAHHNLQKINSEAIIKQIT